MQSIKERIEELVQGNLFLSTPQREQIRAWCKDENFLAERGEKTINMLVSANAQETVIFREILKDDPDFFKNIEKENLRDKLKSRLAQESKMRATESDNIEKFLEDEFDNLQP